MAQPPNGQMPDNKNIFSDLNRQQKIGLAVLAVLAALIFVFWYVELRKDILFKPYGDLSSINSGAATNLQKIDVTLDTDQDGLSDDQEMKLYKTSPYLNDSDGDGLDDRQEVNGKTDPNCPEGQTCATAGLYSVADTAGVAGSSTPAVGLSGSQASILQEAFGQQPDINILRQALLSGAEESDRQMINSLSDDQLRQLYNQMISGQEPAATAP